MSGADDLLVWLILGALVLAVGGFYLWRLITHSREFIAAMLRLRDRIDRARRW